MKKRIVRITAALCAAALLAGCGGSIGSKDGGYYTTEAAAQESYANYDSVAGSVDSGLVPENAAEAATDETAQKIIYNASLSMESTDFDTTREALMTAVEANGAWLESTSLYGTEKDHDRTADYTVRVPVGSYRAFLAAVGDAGSVLNISESAENITSSYIDVQARLSALEAQRDRLNALADQAETTADLLEIESQLSDVQYQLENYTRQLRSMDQQVSYSTVDIYLREVATLTPTGVTFGERIADAFGGGWDAFVGFLQGLVIALVIVAVYLLCWLRRYLPKLFINWKSPEIGCFIYLGGCRNENEALFMSFLGRLPLDVLILCPDLNIKCCLEDKLLYEVNYPESLAITEYPEESSQVKIGTAAYHAERELDTLMYQDSGIYRNQQYVKANVINLQTMYEEIKLLWDQELKYRPNFSTVNGVVNIPVIFSKISGVKDGSVSQYWESIAALITEDTVVVKSAPYIEPTASGPMKAFAVEFYKNGKLLRNKIKNHPRYPYHLLREEMQEFILDKLQLLIERKLIKGIGENGTEYTVIAQILDLPKEILRLIQKFDFTKKNPKLIYINTGETMISLQDSILVTFLNLAGFDILFFVPTGYQSVENYFAEKLMEEHQIGEYKYDMQVPDLNNISTNSTRPSWRRKLFRRG